MLILCDGNYKKFVYEKDLIVMFDSETFTPDMMSNPSLLATAVIQAMEASDRGTGAIRINDPNNGFVMQLFSGVSIFSNFSQKIDAVCSTLYPQRARTASQLYPHLSQFDYVQLMASPATVPFVFAMSKDWIIQNSVFLNDNYNKLLIPSTSYFTMGGITYSMYYPIEILVNKITGAVSAYYDTSVSDSLNTLESNMLLGVQEYTQNGIARFKMTFNMYQFKMEPARYTVGREQGFDKTLPYDDQFYAAKVFYQRADLSYVEFKYSLSELYYDYTSPTVIIKILNDTSEINFTIPQIYFNNNQISQNILIKLYTSRGSVNYAVSAADLDGITANFDTGSSPYAAPLEQMPTWLIAPATTVIAGGSNPMTYDEIRDAVVNQTLYDRVAVTSKELIEVGNRAGFKLTKVIDDLTERMFYASNVLKDTNDIIIPTFSGSILLTTDNLNGDPSTIINHSDGYHTVLPTTVFKIPNDSVTCVPVSQTEMNTLANMPIQEYVDALNSTKYVRQPFHITLLTLPKSPRAAVYNLMDPKAISLSFIKENPNSAPQMSVVKCTVIHQNNGTGGYLVNLGIVRSNNIPQNTLSNYQVFLTCNDTFGKPVYLNAVYVTTENNVDIWQTVIASTYYINSNDVMTVMMYDDTDDLSFTDIFIDHPFNVLTSFVSSSDPTTPKDFLLNSLLPESFQSTLTVMSHQKLDLSLGVNLSSSIYCGVNTTWGSETYEIAETDTFYTTENTIFQTDENNALVTRYSALPSPTVDVVVIYQAGSTPSSSLDIDVRTTAARTVPSSGTSTTFLVNDTTGILVGMPARGLNIPLNTSVLSKTSNSITIDSLITATVPSDTVITITNGKYLLSTTVVQPAVGVQLTVADTSDLVPGYSVFGLDIPENSTVASINSPTQFSLSVPTITPVANGTLLTFLNKTAKGVVKRARGSVVTDSSGRPIVLQNPTNQYRIPAILFDGRIFGSTDPNDVNTVNTIFNTLQNYANQINTLDAGLLEDNQVYYIPARSMGYAKFGVGNSKTITLNLEMSFEVDVYVSQATFNNPTLINSMESSIISLINAGIQRPIISISDITEDIRNTLDVNVTGVEMKGINGDESLRLIALEESGLIPSIEYILVLNVDGTISRVPNITINFIPSPITI